MPIPTACSHKLAERLSPAYPQAHTQISAHLHLPMNRFWLPPGFTVPTHHTRRSKSFTVMVEEKDLHLHFLSSSLTLGPDQKIQLATGTPLTLEDGDWSQSTVQEPARRVTLPLMPALGNGHPFSAGDRILPHPDGQRTPLPSCWACSG